MNLSLQRYTSRRLWANSRANAGLLFPSRARKLADSSQRAFARVAEAGGRTPYVGLVSALFHNLRAVLRDRRETARSAWGHFRRINQSERAVSRPPAVTRIHLCQEPGCRFRIAFYGPSFAGFHDWNLNEEGTRDHGKVTRKYGGPAHV